MNLNEEYLNNVYEINIANNYSINKLSNTEFNSTLNDEEIRRLIFLSSNKSNIFNGSAVRLDKIENIENQISLHLSEVSFFDFMTSNMVYMSYNNLISKLEKDYNAKEDVVLLNKVKNNIEDKGIPDSFDSVLINKGLANIIAISVLVEDSIGNYGLVRRTSNLAIGSNLLSVTVTGSIDGIDFQENNPILSCVKRELKEEINIEVEKIEFNSIAISKKKLQPIFILNCKIPQKWDDIIHLVKKADDYQKEIKEFYSIPKEFVIDFIEDEHLTDAGKYHLNKVINSCGIISEKCKNKKQFKL